MQCALTKEAYDPDGSVSLPVGSSVSQPSASQQCFPPLGRRVRAGGHDVPLPTCSSELFLWRELQTPQLDVHGPGTSPALVTLTCGEPDSIGHVTMTTKLPARGLNANHARVLGNGKSIQSRRIFNTAYYLRSTRGALKEDLYYATLPK